MDNNENYGQHNLDYEQYEFDKWLVICQSLPCQPFPMKSTINSSKLAGSMYKKSDYSIEKHHFKWGGQFHKDKLEGWRSSPTERHC